MKEYFEGFEDFIQKYEAYEKETVDDIVKRFSSTEEELKHTVTGLIDLRYKRRDCEIEVLDKKAGKLWKELKGIQIQRVFEETRCFKDVLALQKRLVKSDESKN